MSPSGEGSYCRPYLLDRSGSSTFSVAADAAVRKELAVPSLPDWAAHTSRDIGTGGNEQRCLTEGRSCRSGFRFPRLLLRSGRQDRPTVTAAVRRELAKP